MSEILAALPGDNAPPILAAGGLANGTQVAAYLTLGAAGAVLGTRFLLTPESTYTDAHKAALLGATSGSTVRTLALDYARGTYGWPKGLDGRGLRNKIVEEIEAGVPHEAVREKLTAGIQEGNADYMVVWSGQGVTLMREIKPAKVSDFVPLVALRLFCAQFAKCTGQDLMAELHTDIVKQLQRSQAMLQE